MNALQRIATAALITATGSVGAADTPDIFHAAEHHLTRVWHSERHELVRIHLGPGDSIGDHRTGPRIIVPLSAMTLESTDGKTTNTQPDTGRWLTNRFSRGVTNVGPHAGEYLALLFPPSNYPPVDDDSQGNCSVLGGKAVNLTHRPYAGACTVRASGDEIMRVDKWRLVYFETDAIMCIAGDCHHCAAGAAWYLNKSADIKPADGGDASIVLFRF